MKLKLVSLGVFLSLFMNLVSCNQANTNYKSSVRDAYNDSISKSWKLKALKVKKGVEVLPNYTKVISITKPVVLNRNFQRDFEDSLIKARKIDFRDSKGMEKLWDEVHKEKIGPIDKYDAIKHGNLKNNQAVIYTDNKFNDCFEDGYWIALSNDNGKNWKQYYTGLTVNKKYYFKNNSKISLWKNSNTLQIEAVISKKISDRILPSISEKYGVVRDSIAIQLNVSEIIKDSDSDGITDIVENKMLLNPNNPDTDGDGIIDSKDKNPRFKSKRTAKSILYEVLMGNYKFENPNSYRIDLNNLPKNKYSNSNRTDAISIFITDDNDIKGLDLKDETLIIMNSKEYGKYKLKYPYSFSTRAYSKMFLCDGEDNVYIIEESSCSSGTTYLVKKTKKGWEVSILEMYVI
jgi:hypothetical protein